MDLLINYGTNASSGGQPVIAEINLQGQASTSLYSYSYLDNKDGNGDNNDYVSTSLIILQNDKTIILNNQNWHYIYAYDSSGQLLQTTGQGYYNTTNTNTNPSSSDRFSPSNSNLTLTFQNDVHSIYVVALKGSRPWTSSPISFTTFQTLTVSYSIPELTATTTFYDSYPGGNVIGTTNGTEIAGVTEYDITWISAYRDGPSGNYFANNDNKTFVEIPIIDNSIVISNITSGFIGFWNNGSYLGWYNIGGYAPGSGNRTDYASLSGLIPIINNATHFSISVGNSTQTTLIVSHGELTETEYDLSFIPNEAISIWNGTNNIFTGTSAWSRTDTVDLQGASQITITGTVAALIFYNSNTANSANVVGIYSERVTGVNPRLGTLQANSNTITVPGGATHFLLTSLHEPDSDFPITAPVSYSTFQTTTVIGQSEPEGYLQIDPPTGKRIKQIILKGL
jgi:hypothetical protein